RCPSPVPLRAGRARLNSASAVARGEGFETMPKTKGGARPKKMRGSTRARARRQARSTSGRAIAAREHERARIARAVHDEIGQALTALRMDVEWLRRHIVDRDPSPIAEKLSAMSALVDGTIDTVQRIATELRPGVLDHLGLEAAAEWSVREFRKRTG